jgi:hypothetical protein
VSLLIVAYNTDKYKKTIDYELLRVQVNLKITSSGIEPATLTIVKQ